MGGCKTVVTMLVHHRNQSTLLSNTSRVRLLFICLLLTAFQHHQQRAGGLASASLQQFCGLETISIELDRRFVDEETGDYLRCRGNVTLTSCEGQCVSSVAPSVVASVGFVKKCTCCREVELRSINIQLAHCVTAEGVCISNYIREMVIQEPSKCACKPCNP
ncbi:partner of bursicon-like [Asterias amurensis]|uniref:partner of bursicon-like n=1 Tax=Asterias amurensis TaxID=7602 RepID=UPI003AB31484